MNLRSQLVDVQPGGMSVEKRQKQERDREREIQREGEREEYANYFNAISVTNGIQ